LGEIKKADYRHARSFLGFSAPEQFGFSNNIGESNTRKEYKVEG